MNIKVKKNKEKMAEQTNRQCKEDFLDTQGRETCHAYVSISHRYTVSMHHSEVLTLFYLKLSSN